MNREALHSPETSHYSILRKYLNIGQWKIKRALHRLTIGLNNSRENVDVESLN